MKCKYLDSGYCIKLSDDAVAQPCIEGPCYLEEPITNAAAESTLLRILEDNVPEKYYLSARACEGILRRAERRGKELPPMLKEALKQMIEMQGV